MVPSVVVFCVCPCMAGLRSSFLPSASGVGLSASCAWPAHCRRMTNDVLTYGAYRTAGTPPGRWALEQVQTAGLALADDTSHARTQALSYQMRPHRTPLHRQAPCTCSQTSRQNTRQSKEHVQGSKVRQVSTPSVCSCALALPGQRSVHLLKLQARPGTRRRARRPHAASHTARAARTHKPPSPRQDVPGRTLRPPALPQGALYVWHVALSALCRSHRSP